LKYFFFNSSKLVFVNITFYVFQMPVILTFLNTRLGFCREAYNQELAPGITRTLHATERGRALFFRYAMFYHFYSDLDHNLAFVYASQIGA